MDSSLFIIFVVIRYTAEIPPELQITLRFPVVLESSSSCTVTRMLSAGTCCGQDTCAQWVRSAQRAGVVVTRRQTGGSAHLLHSALHTSCRTRAYTRAGRQLLLVSAYYGFLLVSQVNFFGHSVKKQGGGGARSSVRLSGFHPNPLSFAHIKIK